MSESYNSGKAGQSPKDVIGKAKEIGSEFQAKAAAMTGDVADAAKDQLSKLGDTAKELAGDATSKAQAALDEQRSLGAQYITSLADAVERAANEFDSPMPIAAQYLRQTAQQIESVAGSVENRSIKEMVAETEQFARRQPALFFGGAVLLGFAALRFLKSAPDAAPATPEVKSPPMANFDHSIGGQSHKGA
jgi:ElaB/YqjD/DUF883 family membrane-anchored ribosome-binding protein